MGACRRRRRRLTDAPSPNRHAYDCGGCDGFADALLCHAAHIATAIVAKQPVTLPEELFRGDVGAIPAGSACEGASPAGSSACLEDVFDVSVLLEKVGSLGGDAIIGDSAEAAKQAAACSFLDILPGASPHAVVDVMGALQPSELVREQLGALMLAVEASVPELTDKSTRQGVCFYHRGPRAVLQTVEHRTSHLRGRWVYHVGSGAAAAELQSRGIPSVTRERASPGGLAGASEDSLPACRLSEVLDYFVCSELPHFVGDSESTWSAVQIAQRHSVASWYDSQFIRLAGSLDAYVVPVVYTYTEESPKIGKLTFQASILNSLKWAPVQVLYHGSEDTNFRGWLTKHGVTVHDHVPTWRAAAEQLRQAGLNATSFQRHRFVSAGKYVGTWQRLDVPLHVSAEYCLLLDSDAFLIKRLTFRHIRHYLPAYLSIGSEFDESAMVNLDAGVTLMNVPSMRRTLQDFQAFVFNHTDDPIFKGAGGIAHHGAYREFYGSRVTWLPIEFSMKPVYRNAQTWKNAFVIHFHGLKPEAVIRFLFTGTCDPATCYLMIKFSRDAPYLCWSIQIWAKEAARQQANILRQFCKEVVEDRAILCVNFFKAVVARKDRAHTCRGYAKKAISSENMDLGKFPWLEFWN